MRRGTAPHTTPARRLLSVAWRAVVLLAACVCACGDADAPAPGSNNSASATQDAGGDATASDTSVDTTADAAPLEDARDAADADVADAPDDAAPDVSPDDDAQDDAAPDAPSDAADGADTADGTDAADGADAADDTSDDATGDVQPDAWAPDFADVDFCEEVRAFGPVFGDLVARWTRQDDLAPPPSGGLVFVGSSSIRRWDALAQRYTDYGPIQRGFGGAQLGEVALHAEALVTRHDPRAVVVFAGTNDVALGVSPETVVTRFRCLRQRIGRALGWARPVFFIGITPTPARWGGWAQAEAVNAGVAALQADDPALHYVDVPAAFLAQGAPPPDALFAADRLHLSPDGYALWDSVLRPAVEAALPPLPPADAPPAPLPPGARVLIDLGPNDQTHGEDSPSPDYLGQRWNNWHSLPGDGRAVAGEHLDDLQTSTGEPTGIGLLVTGGFGANGWANGGLRWPAQDLLGALAVGSATGDFFFCDDDDLPGGLALRGLDPGRRYTLRLFASRSDTETRLTRFVVTGAETSEATVQTSGPAAAHNGAPGNDDDLVAFAGLQPDPWGNLFIEVSRAQGSYAYLSLVELIGE